MAIIISNSDKRAAIKKYIENLMLVFFCKFMLPNAKTWEANIWNLEKKTDITIPLIEKIICLIRLF